jgi:hypothetical protein
MQRCDQPIKAADHFQKNILDGLEGLRRNLPGADPAELEAMTQEHRAAMEDLTNAIRSMTQHAMEASQSEQSLET